MPDTKPNRAVNDIRDFVFDALENDGSYNITPVAIDDTQIGLLDTDSGEVWLVTVQAAKFEVRDA